MFHAQSCWHSLCSAFPASLDILVFTSEVLFDLSCDNAQMALVPFQHAEPSPCISELYTRPVSARSGAEGSTIRRFPEDPLPSDDYTREALLWKKYATRHTGQSVDVQELAKWVLQLHPRCVQDMKPMVILLQGIIKDLLHGKALPNFFYVYSVSHGPRHCPNHHASCIDLECKEMTHSTSDAQHGHVKNMHEQLKATTHPIECLLKT